MKDSSQVSLSRLLIVIAPVLIVAVLGLSLALGHSSRLLAGYQQREAAALRERMFSVPEKGSAKAAAPPPDAPPPTKVMNLNEHMNTFEQFRWEHTDSTNDYYDSEFGSIHLHLIGRAQRSPLHIHRRTAEATAIITGEPTVTQRFRAQGRVRTRRAQYGAGTVVASPPHCGHEWANDSPNELQANLVFASPPFDGNLYIEGDDPRLAEGSVPEVLVPDDIDEMLKSQTEPVRQRRFGFMNDKMFVVTAKGTGTLGPFPGASFLYVSRGRGTVKAAAPEVIEENYLVSISPRTKVELAPDDGAFLLMILFRPENDGLGDIIKKGEKVYSENNEELVIREFFQDKKDGFFLDVGAGHYMRGSNTFYLEQRLGWRGIAVDALNQYAADYGTFRPNTRFENYLVTDKSGGKEKFYHATGYGEASSMSRDVARKEAARHRGDGTIEELEVRTTTLTDLLGRLGIEHLDFLSMDIAEQEPQALMGFDIDRIKPELICIRAHLAVRKQVVEYFKAHGYERIYDYQPYDTLNWYFTPAEK